MKQIIWTSEAFTDDEQRKEYGAEERAWRDDKEYNVSDRMWADIVNSWFDDEKSNLDEPVDGVIIAFASAGRWNGRFLGYQILGNKINDIFNVSEDYNEWFGDGFNIRANLTHHDGTHYVLYRVAKDYETAERIAEQIYNRKIDEAGFRKRTRSLYPYVADVYGWKANRFNKKSKVIA